MPFPIGHGLTALSVAELFKAEKSDSANWKILLLCAALGNLPDCDFFFVWVLKLDHGWHRGFSHSIVFSILIGYLIAALLAKAKSISFNHSQACLFAAVMLSHALLDAATTRRHYHGVELLWPFSTQRIAFNLFPYRPIEKFIYSSQWAGSLSGVLYLCLSELALFGILYLITRLMKSAVIRLCSGTRKSSSRRFNDSDYNAINVTE